MLYLVLKLLFCFIELSVIVVCCQRGDNVFRKRGTFALYLTSASCNVYGPICRKRVMLLHSCAHVSREPMVARTFVMLGGDQPVSQSSAFVQTLPVHKASVGFVKKDRQVRQVLDVQTGPAGNGTSTKERQTGKGRGRGRPSRKRLVSFSEHFHRVWNSLNVYDFKHMFRALLYMLGLGLAMLVNNLSSSGVTWMFFCSASNRKELYSRDSREWHTHTHTNILDSQ